MANRADAADQKPPKTLRIITYNIHSAGPVTPTAESKAAFNADRKKAGHAANLLALHLSKYSPDVIGLQEAGNEKLVKQLAEKLGMQYAFFPGGWQDAKRGWPVGIAGAILTKAPMIKKENRPLAEGKQRPKDLFTRGFGRVAIKVNGQRLWIYNAHLLPSWKNTTHIRQGEIGAIHATTKPVRQAGESVIVLGDMNLGPDSVEYKDWAKGELIDTFVAKGIGSPLTSRSDKPDERIDYIFAAGPIAEHVVKCRVLWEGRFAIDQSDTHSYALSDHIPVLTIFKIE
jgi:endonuclease/exonuclease/phosphatase family metal-dependent hydrolase